MKKSLPKFRNEDAERKFWSTHDSTECIDWKGADRAVLSRLKPSLKTISIRLPTSMIADLRVLANQRDVPYQSLLNVFLAERIDEERKQKNGSGRT
jgi:predicted DNA binding CopG/RHH family protein